MRKYLVPAVTGLLVLVACVALPAVMADGVQPATDPGECTWDLHTAAQNGADLDCSVPAGGADTSLPAYANGSGDDDDDDDDNLICLCHVPRGNPDNARTVCVDRAAVCAHLRHGDNLGDCPAACGGEDGAACEEGQFCNLPEGACDPTAEGECTALPVVCPGIFDPVCGCDGRTYSNSCYADVAGVAIDQAGPCEEPVACGGEAGDTCEDGQFCQRPLGECGEDAEGVCADQPQICPELFAPVCGCDGTTYGNACLAAGAGVTVEHEGECAPEETACGGAAGDTCAEGEFCKKEDGACTEDAEGVCTPTLQSCPAIFAPVCGCDGTTYDNRCVADTAGVTVEREGECSDRGRACGGDAGDTCTEIQSCIRPQGECAEDAEGVCVPKPVFCPPLVAPVCGCDGETYASACIARFVGVTVASQGACPEPASPRRNNRGR